VINSLRNTSPVLIILLLMLPVSIVLPYFTASYGIYVASIILINILIAISYNFLIGYTQQFSLGHVALYAIGAYGTAISIVHLDFPLLLAIPLGAILAGLCGMLVAFPALRLRVFYLAIATLALTMLVHWSLMHGGNLTGGGSGLRVGRPELSMGGWNTDQILYYLILLIVSLVIYFSFRVVGSQMGRKMLCIGEREQIAGALGIEVSRTKILVFGVSGVLVGLAGGLSVMLLGFADPETFFIINVILFFMFVIIGGRAYILGSIVGAAFLTWLWEYLRVLQGLHEIGLGLTLLFFLMFIPAGIVGLVAKHFPGWREARHARAQAVGTPALDTAEVLERARARHVQLAAGHEKRLQSHQSMAFAGESSVMDSQVMAVELIGVSKRFEGITAVNSVSVDFSRGKIHGVIGPNGSGKSTLINLISGVEKADAGEIRLFGSEVTRLGPAAIAKRGLVRSFQDTKLVPSLTVLENVMLGSDKWRTSGAISAALGGKRFLAEERRAIEEARWALNFVSMAEFEHRRGNELSGGQMRLVEIARAVVSQSPIVLLDEPAAGLSLNRIDTLLDLIIRMKTELGVTVILVEHVLNLVFQASDDVTVMAAGEVIFRGTPGQAKEDDHVRRAYLGNA
jgi:branched-chain amino acid transport system permease protein